MHSWEITRGSIWPGLVYRGSHVEKRNYFAGHGDIAHTATVGCIDRCCVPLLSSGRRWLPLHAGSHRVREGAPRGVHRGKNKAQHGCTVAVATWFLFPFSFVSRPVLLLPPLVPGAPSSSCG